MRSLQFFSTIKSLTRSQLAMTLPVFVLLVALVVNSQCDLLQLEEFAENNRIFSAALYNASSKLVPGNFLVSPLSTEGALAIALSGARSTTADEIRTILCFPATTEQTETLFANIPSFLNSSKYQLSSANKLYISNDFPISQDYLNLVNTIYRAGAQNIDFGKPNVADEINRFVIENTGGKIQNAVEPSSLNSDIVALIINAVYFKADWRKKYEKYVTTERDFHVDGAENATEIVTMRQVALLNYENSSELDAQFIEMPFKGDNVSMVIALPNKVDGLAALEERIAEVMKPRNLSPVMIKLTLPKFKIDSKTDLKRVLQELGVRKAFENSADFSGLTSEKSGRFKIDKAIQNAFIAVDEGGVEAAAVTQIGFMKFAYNPPPKHIVVKVDRPFIFYLQVNGVVIFVGRVTSPKI